jgi:hypothetical protein
MIDQVGDRKRVTISEGVETTLTARQLGRAAAGRGGMFNRIISPRQDFLQHKDTNGIETTLTARQLGRAAAGRGGMFNRIISPSQDFLQHKDTNGSAQRPNAMAPRALGWKEAPHAVNFGDQFCDAGLVFHRYQAQLVPEFRLDID